MATSITDIERRCLAMLALALQGRVFRYKTQSDGPDGMLYTVTVRPWDGRLVLTPAAELPCKYAGWVVEPDEVERV